MTQRNWYLRTNRNRKYAYTSWLGNSYISMHEYILRNLWTWVRGLDIDHVNGNGLDNRRENIRSCTRAQNLWNKRKQSGMSSQYKGVWKHAGKWQSEIRKHPMKHYLGRYDTEIEAAIAYNLASFELHGEYGYRNFET